MADPGDADREVDETEPEHPPEELDPRVIAAALAARVREAREARAG
jgi:hypothetical protein